MVNFITYSEFISQWKKFKSTVKNEDEFAEINKNCTQLICNITGISPPKDESEIPEWSRLPALYICYRFVLQQSATKTSDEIRESSDLYNEAMRLLEEYKKKPNRQIANFGQINEAFKW